MKAVTFKRLVKGTDELFRAEPTIPEAQNPQGKFEPQRETGVGERESNPYLALLSVQFLQMLDPEHGQEFECQQKDMVMKNLKALSPKMNSVKVFIFQTHK